MDKTPEVVNLEQMIKKAQLDHMEIPGQPGFKIRVSPQGWDINPILLAGESNVWLLYSIPNSDNADQLKALAVVNSLNSSLPFGVFYVDEGIVKFRNTIRNSTLNNSPPELLLWIAVSSKIIEDSTKDLKTLTAP